MVRRAAANLPDLNGLLIVDKPAGLTSHDIVARVRRMTGMKRVGHAGTLDPFATGLLVVAVGRATRLLQYVQDTDKGYVADVMLGIETDSCDVDGAVVQRLPLEPWPDRTEVEAILATFVGTIDQVPPVYSAIKVGGKKLYELARAGAAIEAPARQVVIHSIELQQYDPPHLHVGVHCGKGTYIRSLARDIGVALGTTAYCHALRRTNSGGFCLANAWTLDDLSATDVREGWPEIALAPDAAVAHLPAVILDEDDSASWYHGRSVDLGNAGIASEPTQRVYTAGGVFVGVGEIEHDRVLRPTVVFPAAEYESPTTTTKDDADDGTLTHEDDNR